MANRMKTLRLPIRILATTPWILPTYDDPVSYSPQTTSPELIVDTDAAGEPDIEPEPAASTTSVEPAALSPEDASPALPEAIDSTDEDKDEPEVASG